MVGRLLRLTMIMAVLALILIFVLFRPTHVSELDYQGERVKITRNQYSIPFIKAFSRKSFYYGCGWVVAEDRLFQMTFRKIVVEGRLAEFVGEPGLPLDKFMREINIKYWGSKQAERLKKHNSKEFQIFQAFVDGINDCATSLKILPLDFHLLGLPWENWTVDSVLGLFKLLQLSQSMVSFQQIFRSSLFDKYSKEEINQFLPNTKQNWAFDSKTIIKSDDIPIHLRTGFSRQQQLSKNFVKVEKIDEIVDTQGMSVLQIAQGSNSWVISGNLTESGRPVLASDPHLPNNIPSQFYQIQGCYENNGKEYCVSGFTSPGTAMMTGKYNYFAIGPTTIYSDCMDFFKQKVVNESYLVDGKWRNLTHRVETIRIKTDEGLRQEVHQVSETHRGPIMKHFISQQATFHIGDDISLQWTGANENHQFLVDILNFPEKEDLSSLLKMGKQGFSKFMNFNFVFITKDDHIGNIRFGVYPLRKNPEMGNFVIDGTTSENDWISFLKPEDKLLVIDPPCGYIVAANNKAAQKEYYNDLTKFTIYTARADRIQQMIEEQIRKGNKFNVETSKMMLGDTVDSYCKRILPVILKVLSSDVGLIGDFDCNFDRNSVEAPVYEVFFQELHKLIKKSSFTKVNLLGNHQNYQYLYNYIKRAESIQQNRATLNLAWKNVLKNQTLLLNGGMSIPTKRWGVYHKDVMSHLPFSKNSFLSYFYSREGEGQGNLHTVNVGKMGKVEFGNYEVSHRATSRAIYSFGDASYWIIDSGADERVYSGHYDDQWKLFMQHKLIQIKPYGQLARTKDQL